MKKNGQLLFVADVSASDPVSGAEGVLYQQVAGAVAAGRPVATLCRVGCQGGEMVETVAPDWTAARFAADPRYPLAFARATVGAARRLFRRLAGGRATAVIAHQPFTLAPLLGELRRHAIPLIYVFHSPSHEEYLLANGGRARALFGAWPRRLVEGLCLSRAQGLVTLSDYMARRAARYHRLPPARRQVREVIPGGVDLERFHPLGEEERRAVRARLGLDPARPTLFCLRNFEPRMGLEVLLQAMTLLREPVDLVLAGDGPEHGAMVRRAAELGMEKRVRFPGFVSAGDLPAWYQAADFFVLPTRELEGFGLVTVEALACGTPVLGTPVGGTREILTGELAPLLFAECSAAAMAQGIEHTLAAYPPGSPAYLGLRQRCREIAVERYSWAAHNRALLTLVDRLASGKEDEVVKSRPSGLNRDSRGGLRRSAKTRKLG